MSGVPVPQGSLAVHRFDRREHYCSTARNLFGRQMLVIQAPQNRVSCGLCGRMTLRLLSAQFAT